MRELAEISLSLGAFGLLAFLAYETRRIRQRLNGRGR